MHACIVLIPYVFRVTSYAQFYITILTNSLMMVNSLSRVYTMSCIWWNVRVCKCPKTKTSIETNWSNLVENRGGILTFAQKHQEQIQQLKKTMEVKTTFELSSWYKLCSLRILNLSSSLIVRISLSSALTTSIVPTAAARWKGVSPNC